MPEIVWQTTTYLHQGGWVMVPLVLVSVLLWTLIVERFRTFRSLEGGLREQLLEAFAGLRTGRRDVDRELLRLCARRLHRGIERYLAIIVVLAGVAPLLGLLGTVLGMIQTFDVIAIFGTGNAQAMAGGISVALVTTQAGLLIAIPGLFLSGRLRTQATGLAIRLDELYAQLDRDLARRIASGKDGNMIDVRRTLRGSEQVQINMGPLVDMVFLLLIFFVVTTSFVKEAGIDVQRSVASTAEIKDRGNIMIAVSAEGEVYFAGKRVDVRSVRGLVERALAEDPESGVVVVADKNSATGEVVAVMNQCRLAGAQNVSLAAKRETE